MGKLGYDDQNLTAEELEIENNLEHFSPIPNPLEKREKKSMTIRLFADDIQKLKVQAYEEGMPYQTMVGSILHKIANKKIKLIVE